MVQALALIHAHRQARLAGTSAMRTRLALRVCSVLFAAFGLVLVSSACETQGPTASTNRQAAPGESAAPYQADVDEGIGAAVAILIDTSGSMRDNAPGDTR